MKARGFKNTLSSQLAWDYSRKIAEVSKPVFDDGATLITPEGDLPVAYSVHKPDGWWYAFKVRKVYQTGSGLLPQTHEVKFSETALIDLQANPPEEQ